MRRWWWALVAVAVVILGLGIYFLLQRDSICRDCGLRELPQTSSKSSVITHLAPGLVPPTNKWFSGVVFGDGERPIYPLPLSFRPTDQGFELHQPQVTTTANTIIAPHIASVVAMISQATRYQVTAYDELTVTMTWYDHDQALAKVIVTQGSPYVFVTAERQTDLKLVSKNNWRDNVTQIMSSYYGIHAEQVATTAATAQISLKPSTVASVYGASTPELLPTLARDAGTTITGSSVDYRITDVAQTTFRLQTANHQPTIFAALPHQPIAGDTVGGTYQTIYGPLALHRGTEFGYTLPVVKPTSQLDLSAITTEQRQQLVQQLAHDIAYLQPGKDDTYFGGKELARAANLMQLAYQLDQKDLARTAQTKLHDQLVLWLTPRGQAFRSDRYFTYDTTLRGVVGIKTSFGSEEFNDHHFHYGYFIYAAALLGQHDRAFVDRYGREVTALVMDIAAPEATDLVPQWRMFDAYAGHGWASGLVPFADGNNQESGSEALNAWTGIALWGDVAHDSVLSDEGRFLMAHERATTNHYWLQVGDFPTYTHSTVGINWGDKRDYATFFSATPNAILGIQLIPMNPVMASLDPARARQIMTDTPGLDDSQFADYLTMYQALYDKPGALARLQQLPDTAIDDGNSRSYLMAWVYSR